MTLTRLLAAALVVCSVPAFAQDPQFQSSGPSTPPRATRCAFGCAAPGNILGNKLFFFDLNLPPAATPAEPWRIVPDRPADLVSEQVRTHQFSIERPGEDRTRYVLEKGYFFSNLHSCSQLPDADANATCHMIRTFMWSTGQPGSTDFPLNVSDEYPACYAIRSYVVARDTKHSDSTHQVSYSTCQPAARYQLRTTEIRSGSADR
jgi:hypothetical protein